MAKGVLNVHNTALPGWHFEAFKLNGSMLFERCCIHPANQPAGEGYSNRLAPVRCSSCNSRGRFDETAHRTLRRLLPGMFVYLELRTRVFPSGEIVTGRQPCPIQPITIVINCTNPIGRSVTLCHTM